MANKGHTDITESTEMVAITDGWVMWVAALKIIKKLYSKLYKIIGAITDGYIWGRLRREIERKFESKLYKKKTLKTLTEYVLGSARAKTPAFQAEKTRSVVVKRIILGKKKDSRISSRASCYVTTQHPFHRVGLWPQNLKKIL